MDEKIELFLKQNKQLIIDGEYKVLFDRAFSQTDFDPDDLMSILLEANINNCRSVLNIFYDISQRAITDRIASYKKSPIIKQLVDLAKTPEDFVALVDKRSNFKANGSVFFDYEIAALNNVFEDIKYR